MKFIDWQYFPEWHLSFSKTRYNYASDTWWEYIIVIGPIQLRWWGKVWKIYNK